MAINPTLQFVGKIDNTDLANYPYGKAQNITTPGDGTGTPFVANGLNDDYGFYQAILGLYGTAPSNVPETVLVSQYLINLQRMAEDKTRYIISTQAGAAINYDSTDHMRYDTVTNVGAITVTLNPAVAPFGDTVTIDKGVGSGAVTFVGGGGASVEVIAGGTLTLDTDGQVGTLVSIDATTWKLIK